MLSEGETILDRQDIQKIVRDKVQVNLRKAFEGRKLRYDLRSTSIDFKPGDIIYRRNFAQSSKISNFNSKLAPKFLKAKIVQKLGNCYFLLSDLSGKNLGVFHGKDLKR